MSKTPSVVSKNRKRDVILNAASPAPSVSSKHSFISNASSFAAISAKSVSPEILDEILDTIEKDSMNLENPIDVLEELRIQLERLREFPTKRSAEPLFNLVMTIYNSTQTTSDEKKQIYILMTTVNTICDPNEMKNLYHKNCDNQSFSKHFLERCYQHFKQTSSSKSLTPKDLPVSLVVQNEFTPRKDIEFAFTCLSNWESSYDGVRRIWDLIKNEPGIDLNDYFDSLDFTQKCFLIAGLNSNMKDENMLSLAPIINELDQRMMEETKSDRVQREAQRVGEKMSELIKNETPKIRRGDNSSFLHSPASSTSSKFSVTSRDFRASPGFNESSISSKTPLKASNAKANITANTSISSRSSKTPNVVSRNINNNQTPTAFGFPTKTKKSILKTPNPINHSNNQNVNGNSMYNQNNSVYRNRLAKNVDAEVDSSSQTSQSSHRRILNLNSAQALKPRHVTGK